MDSAVDSPSSLQSFSLHDTPRNNVPGPTATTKAQPQNQHPAEPMSLTGEAGADADADADADTNTLALITQTADQLKRLFDEHLQLLKSYATAPYSLLIHGELGIEVQSENERPYSIVLSGDNKSPSPAVGVKITRDHAISKSRRRPHEDVDTDGSEELPKAKRRRVDNFGQGAQAGQNAQAGGADRPVILDSEEPEGGTSDPSAKDTAGDDEDASKPNGLDPPSSHPPAPLELTTDINTLAKQIKWVEDCRRVADTAHDKREERWRATSATFHDAARKDRENHERWMVGEMLRHSNMLSQVLNEVKTLTNLHFSNKWETPPAFDVRPPPPPQSAPYPRTGPSNASPAQAPVPFEWTGQFRVLKRNHP